MNSHSDQPSTGPTLQRWFDALDSQEPESHEIEAAQRKLTARLESSTRSSSWRGAGWTWAAAAVLALLVLPMIVWMPGSNGSLAFADVQRYFTDFESLRTHLTTQLRGRTVLDMTIRMDDRDRVRVDVGEDFSYVIDPARESMLQLFHGRQEALRMSLQGAGGHRPEEALDWLEKLREYRGAASPIEQSATIRGKIATGFRLETGGMEMTLWATPEGEPLRMEMSPLVGPDDSRPTTRLEFFFDDSLDSGLFSLELPAGYELLAGDDAG